MSIKLSDDVKSHYNFALATIRGVAEGFAADKWLEPHGDVYYIPSRIAYHLAVYIDRMIAGGFKDADFNAKLPFGAWMESTAETLPDQSAFLAYYDAVVERAQKALNALDDEALAAPVEPERAWMGTSQVGVHFYNMRELSAHTGELNKMLVEDGAQDVWIAR